MQMKNRNYIRKTAGLLFLMMSLVAMMSGCSVNFEDGELQINGSMEFSTEFSTEYSIGGDEEASQSNAETGEVVSDEAVLASGEATSEGTGSENGNVTETESADVPEGSSNAGGEETSDAGEAQKPEEVTVAEIGFRNQNLLEQHYEKHGIEMGFASAEEYELAAYKVIINSESLHKIEAEDGDDVYYLESTNEFVVVSRDGYIRTYFNPSAGIDYFNRQ